MPVFSDIKTQFSILLTFPQILHRNSWIITYGTQTATKFCSYNLIILYNIFIAFFRPIFRPRMLLPMVMYLSSKLSTLQQQIRNTGNHIYRQLVRTSSEQKHLCIKLPQKNQNETDQSAINPDKLIKSIFTKLMNSTGTWNRIVIKFSRCWLFAIKRKSSAYHTKNFISKIHWT